MDKNVLKLSYDENIEELKKIDSSCNIYFKRDSIKINWKDIACFQVPNIDFLKQFFFRILKDVSEYKLKQLITIIYELVSNSFRSNFEYHYELSKTKNQKELLEKNKDMFIHKYCNKCINVITEVIDNNNEFTFRVYSINKIMDSTVKKINKILESECATQFENLVITTKYFSNTGNSGLGLFYTKEILKDDFNTKLNFDYNDEKVEFYFTIEKEQFLN